jgi:hypothetical protein
MISGSSGASRQCRTVEELWRVVIERFGGTPQLVRLQGRQEPFAVDPENEGLPSRGCRHRPDARLDGYRNFLRAPGRRSADVETGTQQHEETEAQTRLD